MSEESKHDNSLTPTIYFFVDKNSGELVGIHHYDIFGIFVFDRDIGELRPGSRDEEGFAEMINGKYDTYEYIWNSEPYDVNSEDWDPADTNDWFPSPAKAWLRGETVTVKDLEPFTNKLEQTFIDPVSPEDLGTSRTKLESEFVPSNQGELDYNSVLVLPPENIQMELRRFADVLHPRESVVLRSRFGLGDGVPKSYTEIADSFGVEPARIRRIEVETLELLRGLNLSLELREFLS